MSRLLLAFDVDSTFVTAEQIDLLAAVAGRAEEVAALTAAAMQGRTDFREALRQRLRLLRGVPATAIGEVRDQLRLTPGVPDLLDLAAARNWPVVLLSGGFHEIIDPLAAEWGVAAVHANHLELIEGRLSGRSTGEVIDAAAKERHLVQEAQRFGIALEHTVAVGDGANDLQMLRRAGLGVAFGEKVAVREAAQLVVPGPSLEPLARELRRRYPSPSS